MVLVMAEVVVVVMLAMEMLTVVMVEGIMSVMVTQVVVVVLAVRGVVMVEVLVVSIVAMVGVMVEGASFFVFLWHNNADSQPQLLPL